MTKLEEKLIELGYRYAPFADGEIQWFKYEYDYELSFILYDHKIVRYGIPVYFFINNQDRLKELVKAFNQLQLDLEVLKEYGKF